MSCKFHKAIFHTLLAAALYAVSIPFSKLLLTHLAPTMLAAFLYIGAARTSAYYAVAPFIGVVLSMIIIGERPNLLFFIALAIMLVGTTYCVSTKIIIVLVKLQSY